MRCSWPQVAALLSSALTSASVIPGSIVSNPNSRAFVENRPNGAALNFVVDTPGVANRRSFLHFEVQRNTKECGESIISLNGQRLDTSWESTSGNGQEFLDIFGGKDAEWHIRCLYDVFPSDGSTPQGQNVVHLLSLKFLDEAFESGFTVSFQQTGAPAILHFEPKYIVPNPASSPDIAEYWRTPFSGYNLDTSGQDFEAATSPFGPELNDQKRLDSGRYNIKPLLQTALKKLKKLFDHNRHVDTNKPVGTWEDYHRHVASAPKILDISADPTAHEILINPKISTIPASLSDNLLNAPSPTAEEKGLGHNDFPYDDDVTASDDSGSTQTNPNFSAAETRSLSAPHPVETAATSTIPYSTTPHNDHNLNFLKYLAGIFVLTPCLFWLFLRCRDPRRRAEKLARREERRNKKLYRRAACQYKWKVWFRNICLKYRLPAVIDLSVNEKVLQLHSPGENQQEAMQDDIRALRNAHRVVSSITAAEEGRAVTIYGSEESEHRRSCSTLPGYESEGSQPPTYDSVRGSLDEMRVADGFRYNAETTFTEVTSNSSVISTSPRLSRADTNSDFDEKIETISLDRDEPLRVVC